MAATPSTLDRLTYAFGQGTRFAWYFGHYLAAQRLSRGPAAERKKKPQVVDRTPQRNSYWTELRALFQRDWENIERGYYATPSGSIADPMAMIDQSRRFFRDLTDETAPRRTKDSAQVMTATRRKYYPRYYLQNFHYQTDGYLSEKSAKLYDFQVETLFAGAADAMRRQALVPLYHVLIGKDQRKTELLDVACGTGSFLTFVKENYPRLKVTGLDLSPDYLREAETSLKSWRDVTLRKANAEHMPFDDESFDIVTSIYLFHELPPYVRSVVAKEIARVLKPGGSFIFFDSIQYGDQDGLDRILELFPERFHEPYYSSYAKTDLRKLFTDLQLKFDSERLAFLSKAVTFRKPFAE